MRNESFVNKFAVDSKIRNSLYGGRRSHITILKLDMRVRASTGAVYAILGVIRKCLSVLCMLFLVCSGSDITLSYSIVPKEIQVLVTYT